MALIIQDEDGNSGPFGPDTSELVPKKIETERETEAERLKQTPSNMLTRPNTAPIEPVIRKSRR